MYSLLVFLAGKQWLLLQELDREGPGLSFWGSRSAGPFGELQMHLYLCSASSQEKGLLGA